MKTSRLPHSAIATAILLAAAVLAKGAEGWGGTYTTNAELTLNLVGAGQAYTGTVSLGNRTFPLSAREKAGVLEGRFSSGELQFEFKAAVEGDGLTFTTGGTAYSLSRQTATPNPLAKPAKVNPLAKPDVPATAATGSRTNEPSGAPARGAAWKPYRHPTGLSMAYPHEWQLKEHQGMLQLIPPDAASNADGPTEAYLVFAEAAEDIRSAEDPRVLQLLEEQLQQLMPFLRRKGEPEKIRAGAAPGVLGICEGTNPKGMAVCAQAYATILRGYGVALVGLGDKKQVAAREKSLRGIFASFAAGEGQKDPQLAGIWKYWHYSSSALGGFSTETTRFLTLRADGTCLWSSRSESGGSARGTDSLGNETWSAGVAGTSGDSDRGTWSAGGGKLYIMWQNGSLSEWSYSLEGQAGQRRLLLKGADQSKADEWMEAPQ